MQNNHLCPGKLEDPSVSRVVSHCRTWCQSVSQSWMFCIERLMSLHQKPKGTRDGIFTNNDKDWRPSKEAKEWILSSFPFYSSEVTNLLFGPTHVWDASFLRGLWPTCQTFTITCTPVISSSSRGLLIHSS